MENMARNIIKIHLFLSILCIHSARCKSPHQHHSYSQTIRSDAKLVVPEMMDGRSNEDMLLMCDTEKLPFKTSCNFLTASITPVNETCQFNISCFEDQELIVQPFSLQIIFLSGSDKALVVWEERNRLIDDGIVHKYAAILAISTCKMEPLSYVYYDLTKRKISSSFSDSIIYRGGFDLIISDVNRCNGLVTCRLSFDIHGTQIGRPVRFPIRYGIIKIVPASPTSAYDGFYVLANETVGKHTLDFKYVTQLGNGTEIDTNIQFNTQELPIKYSNANNMFTICAVTPNKVSCEQYKASTVNPTLDVVLHDMEHITALYSLPNGGFLLVTIKCEEETKPNCRNVSVMEVGKRVTKVGEMIINLECGENLDKINTIVKEMNPNTFCFRLSCASESYKEGKRSDSTFHVFEKCIDHE